MTSLFSKSRRKDKYFKVRKNANPFSCQTTTKPIMGVIGCNVILIANFLFWDMFIAHYYSARRNSLSSLAGRHLEEGDKANDTAVDFTLWLPLVVPSQRRLIVKHYFIQVALTIEPISWRTSPLTESPELISGQVYITGSDGACFIDVGC